MIFCAGLMAATVLAQGTGSTDGPQFTADGQLVAPKDYREWMFLSSGLGMTYGPLSAAGATAANPRFENVFVNPSSYRAFLKTGIWPDQTIFVLEIRSSASKLSINKDGRVQTDIAGVEAEVKDSKRFPGKWAFFDLSSSISKPDVAAAKQIPVTATCYACHAQNGAVDNTFVQFYPTLIQAAREKGTYKTGADQ